MLPDNVAGAMGRRPEDAVLRFVRHIQPAEDSECWLWTGTTNEAGYGRFALGRNRYVAAHRQAWEWANGRTIGPGLTIDHLCFRVNCVRPQCLEEVSVQENLRRRRRYRSVTNG